MTLLSKLGTKMAVDVAVAGLYGLPVMAGESNYSSDWTPGRSVCVESSVATSVGTGMGIDIEIESFEVSEVSKPGFDIWDYMPAMLFVSAFASHYSGRLHERKRIRNTVA